MIHTKKIGALVICGAVITVLVAVFASHVTDYDGGFATAEDKELDFGNNTAPLSEAQAIQMMDTQGVPATLQDSEIEMYINPYGFTVSHPRTWLAKEYPARPEEGVIAVWSVSPRIDAELTQHLNPLVVIVVYDIAMDITEGLYVNTDSGRILAVPDPAIDQTVGELNGLRGLYTTGFEGVSRYDFVENGRRYSIQVNDTLIRKADLSEAELHFVLSTFRIRP
jgi:hypothetical protein